MPNFTAGTSFGANDTVTNTKLNALIADATINPECALNINSGTIGTLSCTRGTIGTFNSTTGTVATLNTTTGSVQTLSAGTLATNLTGGTYSGLINSSTGTYSGLINSSTGTYSGSIGTARSLTAGTIQTLTASTLTGTLTGGTYSGSVSLGTSCNFTAGTIGTFTASSNATINGLRVGIAGGSNSNNVFGYQAGNGMTSASYNSAFGDNAMFQTTTGTSNSAFGSTSLYGNKTGSDNSALGYYALFSSSTAASRNSAFGSNALYSSSGSANTAIGYSSLNLVIYSNCTGVGANSAVAGNNQVQLGDSATRAYAYGALIDRSDLRDKADVKDTNLGLEFIKELRPVDFKWDMREDYRPYFDKNADPEIYKLANITHDGSKKRNRYHHGLIAQEVKEVLDRNGIDFGGYQDYKVKGGDDVLGIGYTELIAPMIKAIQQLSAKVDSLEAQLASK
jgi:hypothetical protein